MATMMATAQAKAGLAKLGWQGNPHQGFESKVRAFQTGWNLGPALRVDGDFDQDTSDALVISLARLKAGKGTCSAHFSFAEFACKCNGRFKSCRRIWIHRGHVRRLEAYRDRVGGQVIIESGCRCKGRNDEVGGASMSQHMFGLATDVRGLRSLGQKLEAKAFAGLGYKRSNKKVIHVDSRDLGDHNTGGSPAHPITWVYAS
jgi:zinc D-Ala-D-Ala carboxypeptidase